MQSVYLVFYVGVNIMWLSLSSQPGTHSAMDYGMDRLIDPNTEEVKGEDAPAD